MGYEALCAPRTVLQTSRNPLQTPNSDCQFPASLLVPSPYRHSSKSAVVGPTQ